MKRGCQNRERDPQRVREMAVALATMSERLRSLGRQRVAEALNGAIRILADPGSSLGTEMREALAESTGLSVAMIEWGLSTSFETMDLDALIRVGASLDTAPPKAQCIPVPARLVVAVLAGNVFTAGLRAVLLPLLAGAPVLAKASSADDVLPRYLKTALDQTDPLVGACYEVLTAGRQDTGVHAALFESAEVVSLYGADATVSEVRRQLPPTARLIAHGHGLGAVVLPASTMSQPERAVTVAERVALDVAAYDQRGCLSPHVVLVQKGAGVDARALARLLAERGLAPLQKSLPRGSLPEDAAAEQMQWRGVAVARGELHEGEAFSTSYEGDLPLRPSPGYRNVGVYDCQNLSSAAQALQPFGVHLKALGVAGGIEVQREMARALLPPLAPCVGDVGCMQTPPLDALADGRQPLAGLLRWIEVR